MAYKAMPVVESGGKKRVETRDDETRELLRAILVELRIANLHHEQVTESEYKEEDLED